MPWVPLAIGGAMVTGDLIQSYLASMANDEQAAAAKDALQKQLDEAARQRLFASQQGQAANQLIDLRTGQAVDALQNGYASALKNADDMTSAAAMSADGGLSDAYRSINAGYNAGNEKLSAGYTGARGILTDNYANAQNALTPLLALQNYGNFAGNYAKNGGLLSSLLSGDLSRQNAYAGFETDPGYEFRRQQGERAIQSAAAASGGRIGGRTLQALADYNQNLAANEYQNFAQRRAALNSLQMQGASTADQSQLGAALGLANVGYGAQTQASNLARELGSGLAGLTSSQAQAQAANDLARGQSLANLQTAHAGNLANIYSMAGQQKANLNTGQGSALATLYANAGANQGSNLTGVSNQSAQLTGMMIPQYAAPVQYAGAGTATWGNGIGSALSNAGYLAALYGGGTGQTAGWNPTGQTGVWSRTSGYGGLNY